MSYKKEAIKKVESMLDEARKKEEVAEKNYYDYVKSSVREIVKLSTLGSAHSQTQERTNTLLEVLVELQRIEEEA